MKRVAVLGACLALLVATVPVRAQSTPSAFARARAAQKTPPSQTWYVKAGATLGGDGSRKRPFDTLSSVEAVAGPGSTIVVLPSPASAPPLDGGIALKPGQRLLGDGPPVGGLSASAAAPRITNTNSSAHSGDAITLADRSDVTNIAVVGAYRGGLYGRDVKDVVVRGNDLSGTNTSCTTGFVVQPFVLPTFVPGVGVPFSSGLSNGWAAIMVDETHTATGVSVVGNRVHDASCADGIDIRALGTSVVSAKVFDNTVTHLQQDPSKQSELAIGVQSTDTARLTAQVDRNSESYIGTATAGDFGDSDSEGLFGNAAGHARLTERVDRNSFAHGLGHVSANCVEFVSSNGGPTMQMTLTNSTCTDVVGDILEAANLSRDATLTFNVDHVTAEHSTFAGSEAWHPVEPGNDGDCMLEVASGAASTTNVNISNSLFTDCVADGLGVVSNVVDGTGAPQKEVGFDVRNSRITANKLSNIRVGNVTPISDLHTKIQHTDLSQSQGTTVILEGLDTSGTTHASMDFGGGSLGSQGHNCIYGGAQGDVATVRDDLSAKNDWWGSANGPTVGKTIAANATIVDQPPLMTPDCGPIRGSIVGPLPRHGTRGAALRAQGQRPNAQ